MRKAPELDPVVAPSPPGSAFSPIASRQHIAPLIAGLAIVGSAAALFFLHLGVYGLWEPDEARYAEIAREMLALHDFIVPHLNYVPYIEKPPMLYWLTALAMRLGGVNELSARFVNAAAAVLGVAAVYCFALRVLDLRRAIVCAIVLMTSALYAIMAQVLTTDMLVSAAITIAFFSFYLQWREGRRWWWLMYFAVAAGTLVKGPVAIILPGIGGAVFLTWEHDWRNFWRRFHVSAGIAITVVIALPWFIAISIRQPDFFQFYIIGEHFRRAFQASYSHGEPYYYYVPILAAGMLPWSLMVPFLPWRARHLAPLRAFCLSAAITVFAAFSLANAKLVPYILPMFPPLAIVIGDGLVDLIDSGRRRAGLIFSAGLIVSAGVGLLLVASNADHFVSPYPRLVRPLLEIAGGLLVSGGATIGALFLYRMNRTALASLALVACAVIVLIDYGRECVEPTRSYAQLAREIERRAPAAVLICYPRYIQSLPFYCRRRVVLIGPETELFYGATHSRDGADFFFHRKADLLRLWQAPQPPVLVVDRNAAPALEAALKPYKIVAQDAKKLAITRADASGVAP